MYVYFHLSIEPSLPFSAGLTRQRFSSLLLTKRAIYLVLCFSEGISLASWLPLTILKKTCLFFSTALPATRALLPLVKAERVLKYVVSKARIEGDEQEGRHVNPAHLFIRTCQCAVGRKKRPPPPRGFLSHTTQQQQNYVRNIGNVQSHPLSRLMPKLYLQRAGLCKTYSHRAFRHKFILVLLSVCVIQVLPNPRRHANQLSLPPCPIPPSQPRLMWLRNSQLLPQSKFQLSLSA